MISEPVLTGLNIMVCTLDQINNSLKTAIKLSALAKQSELYREEPPKYDLALWSDWDAYWGFIDVGHGIKLGPLRRSMVHFVQPPLPGSGHPAFLGPSLFVPGLSFGPFIAEYLLSRSHGKSNRARPKSLRNLTLPWFDSNLGGKPRPRGEIPGGRPRYRSECGVAGLWRPSECWSRSIGTELLCWPERHTDICNPYMPTKAWKTGVILYSLWQGSPTGSNKQQGHCGPLLRCNRPDL